MGALSYSSLASNNESNTNVIDMFLTEFIANGVPKSRHRMHSRFRKIHQLEDKFLQHEYFL